LRAKQDLALASKPGTASSIATVPATVTLTAKRPAVPVLARCKALALRRENRVQGNHLRTMAVTVLMRDLALVNRTKIRGSRTIPAMEGPRTAWTATMAQAANSQTTTMAATTVITTAEMAVTVPTATVGAVGEAASLEHLGLRKKPSIKRSRAF
jgi:hypothetical protein